MRVTLVISSLSAGGAERVVCELANAWSSKGWHVSVVTLAGDAPDHYVLDPKVQRKALSTLWHSGNLIGTVRSNVRRSLDIRRAVCGTDPDVVVSFVDQTNVRVLSALCGSGLPIVISERVDPRRYPIGIAWETARRIVYPIASRLVVQTLRVATWSARYIRRSRITVIPNFVRQLPAATSARDERMILSVGRLTYQKGFDLLIAAFASAGLRQRGYRLVILGDGPDRQLLLELCCALGVEQDVTFQGVVHDPESWMERCGVFVLPSRYEGFPNALLEAMAMGCAVIATDCDSGPGEIVRDRIDGLLVAPDNVRALECALAELCRDAELRIPLSRRATEVRERFARDRVLDQWERLLAETARR
jgi:glycosyltransferase involved in cell wall biosynthesis